MATLEIKKITRRFGASSWGVRDVSLDVRDREFVVLLGPSGCGKTTLLRLVAGLDEPTAGSILIGGSDVTALPPRKRNISMVFQNYAVWPHMPVFENIAFALRLKNLQEDAIAATVREVADMVKISGLLDRLPAQLSGGQRQRVALARALAVKPGIFLMDEPFSNLDAALRGAMRTELKTIHRDARATTVFVTHDQAEAMSMADRIAVMKDGAIVQIGTPDDIYHKCANIFIAGFIGAPPMNFFEVRVRRAGEQMVLSHPRFELTMPLVSRPELAAHDGAEVILGVRPEDIIPSAPGKALFSEQVLVVEPQGSHQVVSVKLEDQIMKTVLPPSPKLEPGEAFHADFRRDKLHLFDPRSTLSLSEQVGRVQEQEQVT